VPRIVDHDARRVELLHATWRVIGRVGLEGATVREIARESGHSNGVLAHYFSNKEDIIIQAHRLAYKAVVDRAEISRQSRRGIDALREAIHAALPLDPQRFLEAVVDISLQGQALHNEVLRGVRQASLERGNAWWAEMVQEAIELGEIDPDTDVAFTVTQIRVLVFGLSAEAVMSPDLVTPEVQVRSAETFLETLRRL
jgi:AcrR family transcriptional regulator